MNNNGGRTKKTRKNRDVERNRKLKGKTKRTSKRKKENERVGRKVRKQKV